MEKPLPIDTRTDEVRAESYRYWRSRPDAEVFDAIAAMSMQTWSAWYKMKGITPPAERSDRSLKRIPHGPR